MGEYNAAHQYLDWARRGFGSDVIEEMERHIINAEQSSEPLHFTFQMAAQAVDRGNLTTARNLTQILRSAAARHPRLTELEQDLQMVTILIDRSLDINIVEDEQIGRARELISEGQRLAAREDTSTEEILAATLERSDVPMDIRILVLPFVAELLWQRPGLERLMSWIDEAAGTSLRRSQAAVIAAELGMCALEQQDWQRVMEARFRLQSLLEKSVLEGELRKKVLSEIEFLGVVWAVNRDVPETSQLSDDALVVLPWVAAPDSAYSRINLFRGLDTTRRPLKTVMELYGH